MFQKLIQKILNFLIIQKILKIIKSNPYLFFFLFLFLFFFLFLFLDKFDYLKIGSSEIEVKDFDNKGPRASSPPESDARPSDLSRDPRRSCDAAEPWQLGSQDAGTPMMQGIIDLHHDIFFFLILILVFVSRILVRALWHFHYSKNPIPQRIVHGTTIEILRTIFTSIIPMFIAIPSFALLYSMGIIHLPGNRTCLSFSLVLHFFLPVFLTLCKWRFYYFPQTGFGKSTTTIEILGTIFLVLMLIHNSLEVAHCAGSWEASSANHNVPPGGEGTSGGNSGWTSILGSSSGESSEASVNQPTGSSNQDRAGPSSAIPGLNANPIEQPAPQHRPFPLLQEQGERGDLLRSLHRLVTSQLKHCLERDLPRWIISSSTNELYEDGAYYIMNHIMDLSLHEDTKEDIQEWIHNVRSNPDLLKPFYLDFKKR